MSDRVLQCYQRRKKLLTLSALIRLDRNALICDLAETYHVYGLESLPVRMVAILSCGLRDDSRIKRKLSASPVDLDTLLLATIVDRLGLIIQRGKKRPESFVEKLMGMNADKHIKASAFDSVEEYEEAKNMILRRCGNG